MSHQSSIKSIQYQNNDNLTHLPFKSIMIKKPSSIRKENMAKAEGKHIYSKKIEKARQFSQANLKIIK